MAKVWAKILKELFLYDLIVVFLPIFSTAFDGVWRCVESTGFEEMMKALGVNEDKARLIGSTRPLTTIQVSDDGFHFKQELPAVNEVVVENDWKFGTPQEDVNEQGEKATTTWTMEGDKMVGNMTNDAGNMETVITREILADGKMKQTVKIGDNSAERVFEKK